MKQPTPEPAAASPSAKTGGLSRRRFIQAMGIGGLGATAATLPDEGLLGGSAASVRPGAAALGPNAVPVTLRVNGESIQMRLEPRVTLLDAIRDHIRLDTHEHVDLTGSKRVCDRGTCGACTVLLDGKTVYACSILAVEAQGQEIVTVEGIAQGGKLHPVQEEFIHCDGSQCGFCTSGFVMASVALLRENTQPDRAQIDRALDGNICRCGTQINVRDAVTKAAARLREGR